jgi:hypothetical protein
MDQCAEDIRTSVSDFMSSIKSLKFTE